MERIHYLARFNGEHVSKSGVSTDRVEKEEERRGERERVRKNGTRGGDGRESSRYPSNMRENLRLANENSAESTLFLPSPLPSPFVHLDYFAKSPISKARQFRPAQFSIHHPPVFVYFERHFRHRLSGEKFDEIPRKERREREVAALSPSPS